MLIPFNIAFRIYLVLLNVMTVITEAKFNLEEINMPQHYEF